MRIENIEFLVPLLVKHFMLDQYADEINRLVQQLKQSNINLGYCELDISLALIHIPVVSKDPRKYYELSPRVRTIMKRLAKMLGESYVIPIRASDVVEKYGEPPEVVEIVRRLEEELQQLRASPRTKAAALVYLAYMQLGKQVKQIDIASKYNITYIALSKVLSKIKVIKKFSDG